MLLHDIRHALVSSTSGIAIQRDQMVTDEHLQALAQARADSAAPAGEMHRVASVPVAVVEKWLAEGFDIYRESARAIVAKLRSEDLGAFVTTTKRV